MKKLLLIAYYFPPDGGAGTQRPAKFCQYLPESGWNVTVLTRAIPRPDQRGRWDPVDNSGQLAVERAARVIRVASSPAHQSEQWPRRLGRTAPLDWLTPAYYEARAVVTAGVADVVLITMSPFWLSHLGRRLQEETGVSVVYDLRDPWALDGWQPMRTWWHWRREMRWMQRTLESAAGVIANTPEAARQMLNSFAGIVPSRLVVVPNGYDAADIVAARASGTLRKGRDGEFLLVHAGTLHGEALSPLTPIRAALKRLANYSPERIVASGRTALHLLAAVRRLQACAPDLAAQLRIVLVGQMDAGTRRCVEKSGLTRQVTCTGYVSHIQSLRWLLDADALFLPLHGLPAGRRSLIVPAKTYEYLASGKVILGCLPDGDARDLLQARGGVYLAGPTDEREIAASLHQMLADWKGGRFKRTEMDSWVSRFERRELTRQLAGFLESILNGAISKASAFAVSPQ